MASSRTMLLIWLDYGGSVSTALALTMCHKNLHISRNW